MCLLGFGKHIVKLERHYFLSEAEEGSEHIVKALHQSQKPLTSLQLWEELWVSKLYSLFLFIISYRIVDSLKIMKKCVAFCIN